MAGVVPKKKCRKRSFKQTKCDGVDDSRPGLSQEYGVLRTVFSHLSILDLVKAERVCRNWKGVAELEKSSRNGCPVWFTFHSVKDFLDWKIFAKALRYVPTVCLTFSTESLVIKDKVFGQIRKVTKKLSCPQMTVGAVDLVHSIIYHEYLMVENWYPVQYVFLWPKFPGADVVSFQLTDRACRKLVEGGGIPSCLKRSEGSKMPMKSLLIFCKRTTLYGARLAVKLQARQTEDIAIGGALIQTMQLGKNIDCMMGLAIYGDNVVASSIVFHDPIADLDEQMGQFRARVVDGEHNIAFMFSCGSRCHMPTDEDGRHYEMGKHCSAEATMFRKHFSTKHFLGILGDGEIGCTCLPLSYDDRYTMGKPNVCSELRENREEKLRHTYSVVIVYIAFNVPAHLITKKEIKQTLCHDLM